MNRLHTTLLLCCSFVFTAINTRAQQNWPQAITAANGDIIKIYQPQPESLSGDKLVSRSALSVTENGKADPVFGMFWSTASVNAINGGRDLRVENLQITDIRFPSAFDNNKTDRIKQTIEQAIPARNIILAKEELQTALDQASQQNKLSSQFNNAAPKVIYTDKPAVLVLIDGSPRLQMNNEWGMEAVINSPYTIVKNNDGRFYLYGGKNWYSADAATGPFQYSSSVPASLKKVTEAITSSNQKNSHDENSLQDKNVIPQIVVSTEPAELIQSDGEANFSPISGTGLLYVKNASGDIFMETGSQQYYVLLSGRWYKAPSLKSQWQYISPDKLPADFAKIPEGSPKDNVLASVAGTDAATNAVRDASMPQTGKVDRKTATASVSYDGEPEFERIDGTRLQYAVNASGTVLRLHGRYYLVDKGVWFESYNPNGPWVVADSRPDDVDLIPPSYPVYNVKYVYIYDVTPDFAYMGYTPGYLNTFICGPTVVYGTGFYYRPWFRNYYYVRPWTWGFSMSYTPWYGWGFGINYNYGWFNVGYGVPAWGYWTGGWWGPPVYRPAYCGMPYRSYGYYGGRYYYPYRNSVNINVNYTNNIYSYRRDVVSVDNRRWASYNNNYNRGYDRGGAYGNNYRGGRPANGNNPGSYRRDYPANNSRGNNGYGQPGNGDRRYTPGNNNPNRSRPQQANRFNQTPAASERRQDGNSDNRFNRLGTEARGRQEGYTPQRRYDANPGGGRPQENRAYDRAPQQRIERGGAGNNGNAPRSSGERRGDGGPGNDRGGGGRRG